MIEIMIVTAIIAASIMMALPYITNRNAQTRKFLREMTILSRELHTKAKLHGVVYRLVIEMPPIKTIGEQPVQKFWIEKSNSRLVLSEDEEERAANREAEREQDRKKDPKGFEIDNGILKEPREMPSGLSFDQIELARLKRPVREGKAFIHYLPQGLVDEAAIHIKGVGNQAWTISIHPLTGRAELIQRAVSLKDLKSQ